MADKVVVVRLRAAVGEYTSGLARAGGQTVSFAGKVAGAANISDSAMRKHKQTLTQLGQGAALAGKLMLAGIGGAMVVTAKAAIDFESSLAGVAKTVDGTDTQIAAIGKSMRQLALDIPVGVNELNKIAELGGQLGVEIPRMVEFTEVIAALGVTTNLSTEDAAKGMARLVEVTGASQQDFGMLASVIVELGNNFATTESEILTFALRIAPVAKAVGVTAEEVLGLSATLSSLGIPAERGGTAMQRVFTNISIAAREGGELLQGFADITGLTTAEFQRLAENSPTEALQAVVEGLDRLNESGGNVFASMDNINVSGVRAQQTLLALSGSTDLLDEALGKANEEADEQNAIWEEAARRYGTTASEIRLMSNSFTDLRIELGQDLIPMIRRSVQVMGAFFDILKNNAGTVKTFGQVIAGIGFILVAGGIAGLITKMIGFLGQVRLGVIALGGLRTGIALTTTAIAGLSAVFSLGLTVLLGGLAFAAANAAAKMADLQDNVDEFEEQVRQGEEPVNAFINILDDSRLGPASDALSEIGGSIAEIGEAGADLDLVKLQATIDALTELQSERAKAAATRIGDTGAAPILTDAEEEERLAIEAALAIAVEAYDTATTRIKERSTEMANAVVSSGKLMGMSFSEIESAAADFLQGDQFATDSDFVEFFTGGSIPAGMRAMGERLTAQAAAVDDTGQSWQAYLRLIEEGSDLDFFDDVSQAAEDWALDMQDAFDDVRSTITEGFPAWDEYEQISIDSMDAVFEAQRLFLEDMAGWVGVQDRLLLIASEATLNWLDGQDAPTLGALARRWNETTGSMGTDVATWNANLATMGDTADEQLTVRMPGILDRFAGEVPGIMSAIVSDLELPYEDQQTDAYEEGMDAFFAAVPQEFKDNAGSGLTSLMDPANLGVNTDLYDSGYNQMIPYIAGMKQSLLDADLRATVITGIADPVVDTIDNVWERQSPSKVAMRQGEDYVKGLSMGMDQGINQFSIPTQRIMPSLEGALTGGNSTTTNTRGGDTFHVHGEDLSEGIRLAGTLAGITRRMETKIGR